MGTYIDLTGQQSGTLIAKDYIGNSKWRCECIKCGNIVEIYSDWFKKNIRLGRDGCKHVKSIFPGDKFGYLTVLEQAEDYIKPKSKKPERQWKCVCVCGKETIILEANLKGGKSTSCGKCGNRISMPEKAIVFYLSKVFEEIEENYRPDFLNGKEIDIYIPSLKVGIEYDGARWHRNLQYDLNKDKVCIENNVHLIHIREPKCDISSVFEYQIITSKPTSSGSHMTNPIKKVFEILYKDFGVKSNVDVDCLRDNPEICKAVLSSIKQNSLLEKCPEIAAEWDNVKNAPLTPDMVPYRSGKHAYWICPNCGNHYHSVIASRTGKDKCGCLKCRNTKKVVCVETGIVFNSLKDAAKSIDKNSASITCCCKGYQKTSGGYHWAYYQEE